MTQKNILKKTIFYSAVFLFLFFLIKPVDAITQGGFTNSCTKDADCADTFCIPATGLVGARCASTKIAIGETCDRDAQCSSGKCQEGKCFDQTKTKGNIKWEPVVPVMQIQIPGLEAYTNEDIANLKKTETIGGAQYVSIPFLANYIAAIYKWALGVAGIILTILIMFGGFLYLTSAGNAERAKAGKDRISHAIMGFALLLISYTLLYAINPELVGLKSLQIKVIERENLQPLLEPSESVINGTSAEMACFFAEFGHDEKEVGSQLVPVSILGKTFYVHKKAVDAFKKVATATNNQSYKITESGSGTFNWRKNVNNPAYQSLHSFGIAIDLNPTKNPNYEKKGSGPCQTDIPNQVIDAFRNNGFRWGGDYKQVCDSMHFEWLGPCVKGWINPSFSPTINESAKTGCCTDSQMYELGTMSQEQCADFNPENTWLGGAPCN